MKKFFDEKITYGNKAVALILLSVIAFLCLNSHSLLSHGEMGTMIEARMPFGEMLRFLFVKDVHPPVHFVLLKSWLSVFGQSVFAARCFSFAGMIACVVFAYVKIRNLFGEKRRSGLSPFCCFRRFPCG